MDKLTLSILFNYNYWANRKILAAAQGLSANQYMNDARLGFGSIHETLVHTCAAERVWRRRLLDGETPNRLLNVKDLRNLDELRMKWEEEEGLMRSGLDRLPEPALGQIVAYKTTKGVAHEGIRWQLLAHVINHGTQHRTEVALALTAFGRSPGDIDLIVYLRQK